MAGKITLDVRPMVPTDIPGAMHLVTAAGWNQTPDDWSMLLNSPGSHLVASQKNQIAGTICALDYDTFLWVAMVLVHPDVRRKGIATMLMEKILAIYQNRVLRLDATEAGAKVYANLGFKPFEKLVRWQIDMPVSRQFVQTEKLPLRIRQVPHDVLTTDRLVFGGDRSAILTWLSENDKACYFLPADGNLTAYSFVRPGNHALQIGPLVANNEDDAKKLLIRNLPERPGQKIFLDSFAGNYDWTEYLTKLGFKPQRNFIRMQKGSDQNFGIIKNQFAIAGPELG